MEFNIDAAIKDIKLFARNEFVLQNKIRILPYEVKYYKTQPYVTNTIFHSCKILNCLLRRKQNE
jgi:hypothetical protein